MQLNISLMRPDNGDRLSLVLNALLELILDCFCVDYSLGRSVGVGGGLRQMCVRKGGGCKKYACVQGGGQFSRIFAYVLNG